MNRPDANSHVLESVFVGLLKMYVKLLSTYPSHKRECGCTTAESLPEVSADIFFFYLKRVAMHLNP
jgi:hypothetical protein